MSDELFLYGDFGFEIKAKTFYEQLRAQHGDVVVRLSSPGGDVSEAVAIAGMLADHGNVKVCIDGLAASAATLVACAGRHVSIDKAGGYMVHGPSMFLVQANADRMRRFSDFLDRYAAQMRELYALRPQINPERLEEWLLNGEDNWFTAPEALEYGFVDEITHTPFKGLTSRVQAYLPPKVRSVHVSSVLESSDPPAPAPAAPAPVMAAPAPAPAAPAPAPTAPALNLVQLSAQFTQRNQRIRSQAEPFIHQHEVRALVDEYLTDVSRPHEQFAQDLIAVLARGVQPVVTYPTVEPVKRGDELERFQSGVLAWAASRIGRPEVFNLSRDAANPGEFRGLTLVGLAAECLNRGGVKTRGMYPVEIVDQALRSNRLFNMQTASDFSVLMENVMHKTLQGAYQTAPFTWSQWCYSTTVTDFRDHGRYRVGLFSRLRRLSEDGEIPAIKIPDGERYLVSVDENGITVGLSRKAIVNDDLNTFSDIVMKLGMSCRRSEELDAITLLTSNPTLEDGVTFFHASRGNIGTAGPPSETAFIEVQNKFSAFKDPANEDFLDLTPAIMLCAKGVGPVARRINNAEAMVAANMSSAIPNVVSGTYQQIIDTPRLGVGGTVWYSFASPSVVKAFEMVHLEGSPSPQMSQEQPFSSTGVRWRVVHVWGVAPADPRGCIYNAGA